jgi:cell wall-associated NlpC family hydrolase
MSYRIRLPLLVLVVAACIAGRASGALGAPDLSDRHDAQRVAWHERRFAVFAHQLLGVPYAYGGSSPTSGFDCSGFTRYVYAHFGIDLPHYSAAQYESGREVTRSGLEPGDLVFFDDLGHVGLYLGGDSFVHAPHPGTRLSIDQMSGWYADRYHGARRLF